MLGAGGWLQATNLILSGAMTLAAALGAGFAGGAALATSAIGVASLWLAVVAGWAWLFIASVRMFRTVPHPDAHRRMPQPK